MPPRILVAPLGWGLGHATRCIAIATEIERQGGEVIWASDGRALQLLRHEYPNHQTLEMPSYDVNYGSGAMVWNIGLQLPKIIRAIRAEHQRLRQIVKQQSITAIISDNRYGCYHPEVPSIFVTHQPNLIVPNMVLTWLARQAQAKLLQKFDQCWIPDYPELTESMAGTLAHGGIADTLPNVSYIGPLTRFRAAEKKTSEYEMVAVLSGPEPQRTFLEQKLLQQLANLPYRVLIVRGIPDSSVIKKISLNIDMVSSLYTDKLADVINNATLVISRPGYSTIMDLVGLNSGVRALFIPTPGQTEQEYLAKYFEHRGIAASCQQDTLELSTCLARAFRVSGFQDTRSLEQALLPKAISKLFSRP